MPASESNPATRPLGSPYPTRTHRPCKKPYWFLRRLVRVAVQQPAEDGHPQNADVQPRRPVRDVVEVVLEPLAKGSVAPPAVHLRPAGDPGFYAVAGHVVRDRLPELVDE